MTSLICFCEEIGRELQKVDNGRLALSLLEELRITSKTDFSGSIFFPLIDQKHHKHAFYAPYVAYKIIEQNLDNPQIGALCKLVIQNKKFYEYATTMQKIGNIVEKISMVPIEPRVQYTIPEINDVSPTIIRLLQGAGVQYQRTELTRKLVSFNQTKPKQFKELCDEFDKRGNEEDTLFSMGNFKIVDELIGKGYPSEDVLLLHRFLSTIQYMKLAIYYGFFGDIAIVNASDLHMVKESLVYNYSKIEFDLSNKSMLSFKDQWMLRINKAENEFAHYQMVSKSYQFHQDEVPQTKLTVSAISIDWL